MKQPISFRLNQLVIKQIKELAEKLQISQAQVIELAVDRLAQQEK